MIEFNKQIQEFAGTLTVDPGDHTGWAFWLGNLQPITGVFTFDKKEKTRIQQIQCLSKGFVNLIVWLKSCHYPIKRVVIEEVQIWEKSLTSMAAAKRGNLFKLSMVIGTYIDRCGLLDIPIDLIKPIDWKGQLPDEAVANRVQRIINMTLNTPHQYSAVGIGLNEIGIFKTMGVVKNVPRSY